MDFHPLSNLFPLLDGQAFATLTQDISANGLREPIVILQGQILDGRNRWRACKEAKIEPICVEWSERHEHDTPLAFVVSMNLHRRHLSESQRAMVADRLAPMPHGTNQHAQICASTLSQDAAADLLNVSRRSVQSARTVRERGTPELVAAVEQGDKTVSEAIREIKREEHRAALSEPAIVLTDEYAGPFDVILADPPWRYDFSVDSADEVEQHYPTLTMAEIIAEPPDAASNALLLLWATAPKLPEAIEVMQAWGFTYKTHAVWDKLMIGTGYWFRGQHELLLVGVCGRFSPPSELTRHSSIFAEKRTSHSKKPICVYEWIEASFPQARKLEMYARTPREGWARWGNEVGAALTV